MSLLTQDRVPTSDDVCDAVAENFDFLAGALEPYFTDTVTDEAETFYYVPLPSPDIGVWFPQLHIGIKLECRSILEPWEVFSPNWAVPPCHTGKALDEHFFWGDGQPNFRAALGAVLQVWFTNEDLHNVLDFRCASGHSITPPPPEGEE